MSRPWPRVTFGEFLRPHLRPHNLGPEEDADLVGMRWYGEGPFHRELKSATQIVKKSHFLIRSGDVIYNKLFAWKGAFGVVPPELDRMFVSDKFPTYALDRDRVDEHFLRWYFRYPPLWNEARGMSTGSAALSKLTLNPPKFLLLTIPLPSDLVEQRRVAAQLGEVATHLREARSLRQEATKEVGVLVASALHRISASVDATGRLSDVLARAPRNGWSIRCDGADDGTAVLSLRAVTGFHYRGTEFKRTSLPAPVDGHYWLQAGDLLITRSNTEELVGHAAIYSGSPAPCIYPDLMMRLETHDTSVERRFVWYWLQSPMVREFIRRNAKGTSPSMKKISQGIVMNIPFPSGLTRQEQRRIVAELDALQEKVDALKRLQSETTEEVDALLPSVLDRAFKGCL